MSARIFNVHSDGVRNETRRFAEIPHLASVQMIFSSEDAVENQALYEGWLWSFFVHRYLAIPTAVLDLPIEISVHCVLYNQVQPFHANDWLIE